MIRGNTAGVLHHTAWFCIQGTNRQFSPACGQQLAALPALAGHLPPQLLKAQLVQPQRRIRHVHRPLRMRHRHDVIRTNLTNDVQCPCALLHNQARLNGSLQGAEQADKVPPLTMVGPPT